MTSLEEKINAIIEFSDFNDLPYEERVKIRKYTREQHIQTLWQILNKDKDLITEAWRKKTRKWLAACVETYQREEMANIRKVMDEEDNSNFAKVTTSPEALAEFITGWVTDETCDGRCPLVKGKCKKQLTCENCVLEWLKQEAKEDD